jgi:anti-sigma regulatory factor (Ser/Thr protein kinase)
MARTAAQAGPRLIAFALPGIPESVPIARLRIRAALGSHGLGEYADDAEIITSELVTNAIQHVPDDDTNTIVVTLARVWNPAAVTVVVSDSSSEGPVRRDTSADSAHGRGLQIVQALSAHCGWHRQDGGKAIFATLALKA